MYIAIMEWIYSCTLLLISSQRTGHLFVFLLTFIGLTGLWPTTILCNGSNDLPSRTSTRSSNFTTADDISRSQYGFFTLSHDLDSIKSQPSPLSLHPLQNDNLSLRQDLFRTRRSISTPLDISQLTPPRIVPDLPPLRRFFDHTGAQVRCLAEGNPRPTVRWFVLPPTIRTGSSSNANRNFFNGSASTTGSTVTGGGDGDVVDSQAVSEDAVVTVAEMRELGFNAHAREALNVDDRFKETGLNVYLHESSSSASSSSSFDGGVEDGVHRPPTYPNQYVVGDGWLNFTATPRSSTLRMVFFCQAENILGKVRSRKMVIHQVPVPDDNLRIKYSTFPIIPSQKAVVKCQAEQEIFNRFLKVKYWEVFRNGTRIANVTHSANRYSVINATKYPELHIRNVDEWELKDMRVRCILQSIVDESREIRRPETGGLKTFDLTFPYEDVRSVGTEVNVLAGSTTELPWAIESMKTFKVQWYWRPDRDPQQRVTLDLDQDIIADSSSSPSSMAPSSSQGRSVHRPWGSRYEFVQGKFGNLRLVNVSVEDSGEYSCEAPLTRRLRVAYVLRVRAPIDTQITPKHRVFDFGTRVELECLVTGYPHQMVYWLHNAKLISPLHQIRRETTTQGGGVGVVKERLVIASFGLEDTGVYQCVAESSADDQPTSTTTSTVTDLISKAAGGGSGRRKNKLSVSASRRDEMIDMGQDVLIKSGHSVGDLVDNAQDTAHLIMGKMAPIRTGQDPKAVEPYAVAAPQLLLSAKRRELKATIECRFAANPLPSITWYRDDLQLPHDEVKLISSVHRDVSRAYSVITRLKVDLETVPVFAEDLWQYGGEYRAVANNTLGSADCRTFVLLDTPLRLRPVDTSKPAIAGRSHDLKCYFTGSGIPKLQWHRIKNGQREEHIPVDHRHQLVENARVLRITEVNKEQDEAEYRCTAKLDEMEDDITISLKVSRAPRIQDLPEVQRVQGGRQSLTHSCATQNHADKPWYAWWQFQPESADSEIVTLPPNTQQNSGAFQVSYAADIHKNERWNLPDTLKHSVPSFVHQKPNSVVHVRIEQLNKRQHQGILTCKIMNAVGYDERSIRVTFIPELEFKIRPPNKQDVTLAQNISINCTAVASELAPIIVWKYSDESTGDFKKLDSLTKRTEGRIFQEANGTLVISQVEEADPRKFLCFLNPKESSTATPISVAVNLEVHVPARIEPLKDVDQVRGSQFNLTCVVHGDGNDLRTNWYHRQSPSDDWILINRTCVVPASLANDLVLPPLQEGGEAATNGDPLLACQNLVMGRYDTGVIFRQISVFKQNGRGMERQLQFDSLKVVHMGEYMCRASNFYNRDPAGKRVEVDEVTHLTVISVPDEVTFVHNISRTFETSATFAWLPPAYDGNKRIKLFRIRYYQPDSPTDSSLQEKTSHVLDVDANQHQATLTGLRPYTKYHIDVMAINDVGVSMEKSLALTTQEAKPDGPVQQLNATGTASDTIYVSWKKPKPEHQNGNVDRYWVCSQRVNESLIQHQEELAKLGWPANHQKPEDSSRVGSSQLNCALIHRQQDTELTGLPKFTAYAIRVIAINNRGQSPPAFVLARTLEDLPQAPPTNVTCSTQQHSITVSWNPPNLETVNGILTEYLVNYFIANDFGDETNSVNQVVKGQTTVTLAGLLANTKYTIQVAASNRKGRGPLSSKQACVTTEAPPDAPEKIKATSVNETCVMVSWSHPSRPQGVTRFYCLSANRQDLSGYPPSSVLTTSAKCIPPDFSKPYNYHLLCNLVPQVPYDVSVMAKNRFDGRPASIAAVSPTNHPPDSIISIGGTIVAQENMRVSMDCLVIGGGIASWSNSNGISEDVEQYSNGTLLISAVKTHHSGRYVCKDRDDSISYDLKVKQISNDPPKPPVFHKLTPSLRNIQVEWLSPGSRQLDAPIRWFHLNWTNEYSGKGDSIRLPADRRTFYLSNLTCATAVRFQIRAENQFGFSEFTDSPISARTSGSAPQLIDVMEMIPQYLVPIQLRLQTSVIFNLSVFTPGHSCSPTNYQIWVWPAADGPILGSSPIRSLLLNQTLTRHDLFSLDKFKRCCFNVTSLRPSSYYGYHVVAENPAGKTPYVGSFWTRNSLGVRPVNSANNQLGKPSFLSQPTIIVPLTIFFVLLFITCVCIVFYCRHRRLESVLAQTNKQTTLTNQSSRGGSNAHDAVAYGIGRSIQGGVHRGALPPIPVNEKAQYPSITNDRRQGGRIRGFFASRPRVYDRGRSGPVHAPQPHDEIDEDRLSTNSMDSVGNLNPYATYAACGVEESQSTPTTAVMTNLVSSGAPGKPGRTISRTLGLNEQMSSGMIGVGARPYKTFTKGGHPSYGLQGHQGSSAYMQHQYHYPNFESAETESRLERVRMEGGGGAQSAFRNRLLAQHHALLDPPLLMQQQPYVNNTLDEAEEEDLDEEDVDGFHRMGRRVNSLESIQHVFRHGGSGGGMFPTLGATGGATTYHRGYAAGRRRLASTTDGPSTRAGGAPISSSTQFFEPGGKSGDGGNVAYRGSVLSSTTVSSNQDELMQAYEYGRKQFMPGVSTGAHIQQPIMATTAKKSSVGGGFGAVVVPRITEIDASGGSGSSETTDPGICQFTQQPPRPEDTILEAANGAVVVQEMAPGGSRSVQRGSRMSSGGVGALKETLPPFLQRQISECPSELTDTYASVDYTPSGPYAVTSAGGPQHRVGPLQMYGRPTKLSHQQAALARVQYPDLESDSGMSMNRAGPGFHRQSSQQSCSYYYPTTTGVNLASEAAVYSSDGHHLTRPATMANLPSAAIGSAARAVLSSGGMFLYGAVGGSTSSANTMQQQQQQQPRGFQRANPMKVNPRKSTQVGNKSSSRVFDSSSTGYGSASRVEDDKVDGQQTMNATGNTTYGIPRFTTQPTSGPVPTSADDEENVYTSEFVVV